MYKYYFTLIILLILSFETAAQNYTLSGVVRDAATDETLLGVNIYINAINRGTASDAEGRYEISNIPAGTYEVTASFVGYLSAVQNINVNQDMVFNFSLKSSPVLLQEAVVRGTRATLRETPVAFSQVEGEEIEFKLASRDLPQVLNVTPSLYSSAQGGGAGDANLFIRGFNQRNIAIMINGVPVNDMENGWVYWSNWAGLGDVTQNIQVQRGLGASPYSVSSIGGVVNILTFGAGGRREFSVLKQEFGSNNLQKTTFAFSSMVSEKVGLTALVSRKIWDGYAVGTYLDEFTYFLSIGGVFGNHSLELTGVGSPQEHGQRVSRQTIDGWYAKGFDYNANYGFLFGEPLNEVVNKYHKPQFNFSWNWQMNPSSVLSTIAYYSIGNGYGSGRLGSGWIYDDQGLIDFDAVWERNENNVDTVTGASVSSTILRNSVNNHYWTGLLSTIKTNLSDRVNLSFGIDGRYYIGEHYREIRNLLGGDYWINTRNVNNPNQIARTGDKVDYYNDGEVILYGGFGQVEYSDGRISTFLNISASNTGYQRIDYFNFLNSDPDQATPWQYFLGYTAKTGVNYNFDEHNNVFANVGYFSKAPIFDNVFDFSNNIIGDAENENILGIELGYGLATPVVAANLNVFYTDWSNRAISVGYENQITNEQFQANISGADQRHIGVEFEGRVKPVRNLEFSGMFSFSENKFLNDVSARLYPEDDPSQVTIVNSYVKDLYVSEYPMTTAALEMEYRFELSGGSALVFNPVYKFYGRYYSFFNPDQRDDPDDRAQSWRIPDFYLLDIHAAYEVLFTDLFMKKLTLSFHLFNALNNINYITDAVDGRDHTRNTSTVWIGRERWFNLGVGVNF